MTLRPLLASSVLGVSLCVGVAPLAAAAETAGDAERGRALFASKQCARCHVPRGLPGVGPRLEELRRPQGAFALAGRLWNHAPAMFTLIKLENVAWPADYDWISNNTDTVDTVHLGASVGLIPRVLDWTVGASYAYALGRLQTRNPVAPTSGSASQDAAATAKPTPAFEDTLLRLETALKYHFWKMWTASFGYVFESFEKNDWRTDRLNPFVPGVTSIWLGNDARNYSAHIVAVTLGVRFR
jgi:hypothetical protein